MILNGRDISLHSSYYKYSCLHKSKNKQQLTIFHSKWKAPIRMLMRTCPHEIFKRLNDENVIEALKHHKNWLLSKNRFKVIKNLSRLVAESFWFAARVRKIYMYKRQIKWKKIAENIFVLNTSNNYKPRHLEEKEYFRAGDQ